MSNIRPLVAVFTKKWRHRWTCTQTCFKQIHLHLDSTAVQINAFLFWWLQKYASIQLFQIMLQSNYSWHRLQSHHPPMLGFPVNVYIQFFWIFELATSWSVQTYLNVSNVRILNNAAHMQSLLKLGLSEHFIKLCIFSIREVSCMLSGESTCSIFFLCVMDSVLRPFDA